MLANEVAAYVAELQNDAKISPQIVAHRIFEGAPPVYADTHLPWSGATTRLLFSHGINLYSHQALATDHIRAGRSIVAATPTASGKSLIYNLPVLEAFAHDPDIRALYLFPLKALAQDQLGAFNSLCSPWPVDARPQAALYDGDTTDYMRRKIRNDPPCALITNPEMLHLAIMPHHEKWTTFLANLTYVIVDEAHTYRGVFGSNMAQVFRRLNRIAMRYGADPHYIFCTATLGNPAELAKNLMGGPAEPVLIDKSGAPQGKRHFLFVNPDQSAATCAISLLKKALDLNLRAIVYCQSRRMTELISLWAGSGEEPYKSRISAYRAGFLPEERREIEGRMASGELGVVITTSALELGIDIGGLDVCILVGYPGTVMQTLQRAGRVGRAQRESAVIIVTGENAMDQYFARNPDDFFSRPPEKAIVNPDNETILAKHLECAAAEMPLSVNEAWLQNACAQKALGRLAMSGAVLQSKDGSQWLAARKQPQRNVDLRGSGENLVIQDEKGNIIGIMEEMRAWRETHTGAVYIHHGRSYVITDLDAGRGRIMAREETVGWYTRARSKKSTVILEEYERRAMGNVLVCRGRLRITEEITGYEKRATNGKKLLTIMPLEVPPHVFESEGIWFVIPDGIRLELEKRFIHFMGSIHALEHAVIGLLPMEVMADRNDFGGISIPLHPQIGLPAVFVYDSLPGGAGLTRAAFPDAVSLLGTVLKHLRDCPCEDGCPSCVQSPKCGAGNRPLSKQGSITLLEMLLADGNMAGDLLASPRIDMISCEQGINKGEKPALAVHANNFATAGAHPPDHYVVFDVETRHSAADVGGWRNMDRMEVSLAVLYDSREDRFFTYEQHQLDELFERMAAAKLVIGFNSLRFDYQVLRPFAEKLPEPLDLTTLPSLDLLRCVYERLNYRVSLENLCKATLNAGKSANGLQALLWWKQGKLDEIARYCQMDVELTRDLYLHGLREGYVAFTNKAGQPVRVPVDFNFSPAGKNIGL